jgi:hypothetical protein
MIVQGSLSFDDLPEAMKPMVAGNDRVVNHLATPEYLARLTTCCLCGFDMAPERRYLCEKCSGERP